MTITQLAPLVANYDPIFEHLLPIEAVCFCMFVVITVGFILDENTPASIVLVVGFTLVTIAGYALYGIDEMGDTLHILAEKHLISSAFLKNFDRRSNLFLFVFPFASAAIGTNLISDVITKKLHYKKKLTFTGICANLFDLLKTTLGFIFLVPVSIIGMVILAAAIARKFLRILRIVFKRRSLKVKVNSLTDTRCKH